MADSPKVRQKPHKWNREKDARACVECGDDFKAGDSVYTDVALTIHAGCLANYRRSGVELGLITAPPSPRPETEPPPERLS